MILARRFQEAPGGSWGLVGISSRPIARGSRVSRISHSQCELPEPRRRWQRREGARVELPEARGAWGRCGLAMRVAGKPEAQAEWNTPPTTRGDPHSTRLAPRASRRRAPSQRGRHEAGRPDNVGFTKEDGVRETSGNSMEPGSLDATYRRAPRRFRRPCLRASRATRRRRWRRGSPSRRSRAARPPRPSRRRR